MRSYPRTTFEIDDPNLPKQRPTNKSTQKQSESSNTNRGDDNNANQKQ